MPDQNRPIQDGAVWHGVQPPPQDPREYWTTGPGADPIQWGPVQEVPVSPSWTGPKPVRWALWNDHNDTQRREYLDANGDLLAVAVLFDSRQWLVFRLDRGPAGSSGLVYVGELFHYGPGLDRLLAEMVEQTLAEAYPNGRRVTP